MTIDDLLQQIQETERLITVYPAMPMKSSSAPKIKSIVGAVLQTESPSRRPRLATKSSISSSVGLRRCGRSSKTQRRIASEKQMVVHDSKRRAASRALAPCLGSRRLL